MFELFNSEADERTHDRDAGVVDEPEQRLAAERRLDLPCPLGDRRLVGHVEDQRREVRAELVCEPLGVALLAHAAEDAEPALDQDLHASPPDSGGHARNDDRFHQMGLAVDFSLK